MFLKLKTSGPAPDKPMRGRRFGSSWSTKELSNTPFDAKKPKRKNGSNSKPATAIFKTNH